MTSTYLPNLYNLLPALGQQQPGSPVPDPSQMTLGQTPAQTPQISPEQAARFLNFLDANNMNSSLQGAPEILPVTSGVPPIPSATSVPEAKIINDSKQAAENAILNQNSSMLGFLDMPNIPDGSLIGKYAKSYSEAAGKLAENKIKELQTSESIQTQMAKDAQRAREETEILAQKYNTERQAISKELDIAVGDYKKSLEIDPTNFFKKQGIAGTILSILGVAIGGFASGYSRTPNYAANMLENAINRDIQAQIEKRNGLRSLVSDLRDKLGDARVESMNSKQLLDAAVLMRRAEAESALNVIKNQYERTNIGQMAAMASADFGLKTEELRQKLINETARTRIAAAGTQIDLLGKAAAIQRMEPTVQQKLQQVGIGGYPISDKLMNDALDVRSESAIMRRNIEDLKTIIDKHGTEILPTTASKSAKGYAEAIRTSLRKLQGMGVPTGKDDEMLQRQLVSDPTQFRQTPVKQQLDDLMKRIEVVEKSKLRSAGLYDLNQSIEDRALGADSNQYPLLQSGIK